jgi:hypothetical protein
MSTTEVLYELDLDATTEQIADMLGISAAAVEELASARLIPSDRLGRGRGAYWAYDSHAIARMFDLD